MISAILSVIFLVLMLAAFASGLYYSIRKRKRSGCSGCSGCPSANNCGSAGTCDKENN